MLDGLQGKRLVVVHDVLLGLHLDTEPVLGGRSIAAAHES